MLLAMVSGCETQTIRYAAFEDLVLGSYTVNFYTNGECAVEMGAGYHEGTYTLKGDTLLLTYRENSPKGLPTRLLLTPNHIVTLPTAEYPRSTKISRR
jgi:hypothetical protein